MTVAKAIARAWSNADYKAKLKHDPHAALSEIGVHIPPSTTIKVVEDTAETTHIVLPLTPPNVGEMSAEELARVAGGYPGTSP